MDYQILALDLDGTLTNSEKEISEPTKEALIDIQKNGKKVILASGRPTIGVKPLADELKLSEYGGYILSFNGGCITDCQSGRIIYNRTLPDDVAAPLYHIARKYSGVDILAYTENALLSGIKPNRYTDIEAFVEKMPVIEIDDFPGQITEPGNKLLITGEANTIELLKKEVSSYFRSYLSVYCSDPFFLEIMPAGIDKAHSLLKLLTSIGMSADEMICCGDSYNDLTMIETAGLGVAMANALPAVKEQADYITKSNDEDGILHVINEFMR